MLHYIQAECGCKIEICVSGAGDHFTICGAKIIEECSFHNGNRQNDQERL